MLYRRWIYILIDIVAHSLAVYAEVSMFLRMFGMFSEGHLNNYTVSTMFLEALLVGASVLLSVFAEYVVDRADSLEEKGQTVWENGILPKL